jgi:hypothetical protein
MEHTERVVIPAIDEGQSIGTPAPRFDRAELTGVVRQALERRTVEIDSWEARPLTYDYTSPITGGIYRVTGSGTDAEQRVAWSLVLKVVRSAAGVTLPNGVVVPRDLPDGPSFFGYWKREPQVYGAGLLENLPGGLTAPRCYGVSERSDGTIWLWLEEIADGQQTGWTPERCILAAHTLGRFNGAYLAGRPMPVHPCLDRGWLHSWLGVPCIGMIDAIRRADAWEHPLVRGAFPESAIDRVLRLWADREMFLDGLDRLPQTFYHRDAFRSNLLWCREGDGQERIVAIDWAYTGIGPVGEELAPLIVAAPAGDGAELAPWIVEAPMFNSYLQGLSEAGWSGEIWSARFGFTASAALRYLFMTVAEMLSDVRDEARHASIEQRRGQPIAQVVQQQAALIHFLLGLADEARALLPRVTAVSVPAAQRENPDHHPT